MKRHIEPFWWTFFGAGGAISALFLPVLLFFTGIAFPLGWVEAPGYQQLYALVSPFYSRLLIFVVISLSMFHWAHRFRFTLYDGLQLQHFNLLIAIICYGTAIVATLFAGYLLWNFGA